MKRTNWIGVATCCGAMLGISGVASAQLGDKPAMPTKPDLGKAKDAMKGMQPEKKDAPAGMPADKQAEMDAWMKAGTPGAMHTWLAKDVGTWDATVKMTMPGEPSTESTGTMKIEMVLGGRYQRGTFEGSMMGMPFEGVATMGYDNQTQTFQGTWMDSFTTATMFMSGKMEGDKLVMRGEMKDPTNGKLIKEKQVVTHPSNDKMVDEFFHEIDGKDVPVMSIVYARAAKSAITPVGEKDEAARAKEEMMKKMKEEMEKKMKGNMPGH